MAIKERNLLQISIVQKHFSTKSYPIFVSNRLCCIVYVSQQNGRSVSKPWVQWTDFENYFLLEQYTGLQLSLPVHVAAVGLHVTVDI